MNRSFKLFAAIALTILAASVSLIAEVPQAVNYQGWLTDNLGNPITNTSPGVQITFTIWNDETGSAPANQVWTSGPQMIPVEDGLFTYQIGSPPASPLPHDIFSDTLRWLGIKIGSDPEITPRTKLTSAPYVYHALRADTAGYAKTIADNSVTSAKILDGEIVDDDISVSAAIAVDKISGTAVNLISAQTIDGDKTFNGTVYFGDSSMIVNNDGITLGRDDLPVDNILINLKRRYNTADPRYGIRLDLTNQDVGEVYGMYCDVYNTSAMNTGNAYGLYTAATSDANVRYGVLAYGQAETAYLTTGVSYGVKGYAKDGNYAYGVYGIAEQGVTNFAGYFNGDVEVTGTLSKGGGMFKIDHPLEPKNKYLCHSFVESPDMMNVYNGNVTLNADGEAVVELPDYFQALNKDFRYQLTAIGAPGPNLYISEEISANRFKIAGGEPLMKVSWQVTGVRKDAFAEANRIKVEIDKPENEKGLYLHPEAFGLSENMQIHYELNKSAEAAMERGE